MRNPYYTYNWKICPKCGLTKRKYKPKNPRDVNPYDAGQPRVFCKCK